MIPRLANPEGPTKRIRASVSAIKAALVAVQDSGLTVDKVCVAGGKIEIHCGDVEEQQSDKKNGGVDNATSAGQFDKDGGLEDW